MSDLTNPTSLPNGYKNGQQAPLDGKGYFENDADMQDTASNRPLEWYKEMLATNREDGKIYQWKESVAGLISGGYTYPASTVSFGFDYSGKTFNWVLFNPSEFSPVQSDWAQVDSGQPDYIKNKPTVPIRRFKGAITLNTANASSGNYTAGSAIVLTGFSGSIPYSTSGTTLTVSTSALGEFTIGKTYVSATGCRITSQTADSITFEGIDHPIAVAVPVMVCIEVYP